VIRHRGGKCFHLVEEKGERWWPLSITKENRSRRNIDVLDRHASSERGGKKKKHDNGGEKKGGRGSSRSQSRQIFTGEKEEKGRPGSGRGKKNKPVARPGVLKLAQEKIRESRSKLREKKGGPISTSSPLPKGNQGEKKRKRGARIEGEKRKKKYFPLYRRGRGERKKAKIKGHSLKKKREGGKKRPALSLKRRRGKKEKKSEDISHRFKKGHGKGRGEPEAASRDTEGKSP